MTPSQSGRISRRTFLRAIGTGGVMASTTSLLTARGAHAQVRPRRFVIHEDRFGRIFPELPPFANPSPALRRPCATSASPGGILDAKDNLAAGPVALIVDPALSVNNPNNPTHTAGTTFMGQFMDHDMTFDLTSRLGVPADPEDSPNARTPALDLDSVYGGGPLADPELYGRRDDGASPAPTKFKIESGGLFEDLPRDAQRHGDHRRPPQRREPHHRGLHAAFLLLPQQGRGLSSATRRRETPDEVFRHARQLTTWHYQWMILHEFLPLFIGQAMVDDILSHGRRFYRPDGALIPVEFQGAAYRFGHSHGAALLPGEPGGRQRAAVLRDDLRPGRRRRQADPVDLRGGARAPRRFIGWQTFFNFGDILDRAASRHPRRGRETQQADRREDLHSAVPPAARRDRLGRRRPPSLPQRNLLRHVTWQLPSGQRIADAWACPALSKADLNELSGYGLGLDESTPLWYYILKEGHVRKAAGIWGRSAAASSARSSSASCSSTAIPICGPPALAPDAAHATAGSPATSG